MPSRICEDKNTNPVEFASLVTEHSSSECKLEVRYCDERRLLCHLRSEWQILGTEICVALLHAIASLFLNWTSSSPLSVHGRSEIFCKRNSLLQAMIRYYSMREIHAPTAMSRPNYVIKCVPVNLEGSLPLKSVWIRSKSNTTGFSTGDSSAFCSVFSRFWALLQSFLLIQIKHLTVTLLFRLNQRQWSVCWSRVPKPSK